MKNTSAILSVLFLASISFADTIYCKVIRIYDGATISCLTSERKQIKVRLWGIDAPDNNQAYGQKAKQALSDMILNKHVDVKTNGKDTHKRILGAVSLIDLHSCCYEDKEMGDVCTTCDDSIPDINLEMIKQGHARNWSAAKKNPKYQQAERDAKVAKRGLWSQSDPVTP